MSGAELTRSCSELQSNGLIGVLPETAGSLTRLKVLCAPVHCGRALRLSRAPPVDWRTTVWQARSPPALRACRASPGCACAAEQLNTRESEYTPPVHCATAAHVAPCPQLGGFSPRMARCRAAHDAAGLLSGRALSRSGGSTASTAVGLAAGHRRPAPRKRPLHGGERAVSLRAGGVDGVARRRSVRVSIPDAPVLRHAHAHRAGKRITPPPACKAHLQLAGPHATAVRRHRTAAAAPDSVARRPRPLRARARVTTSKPPIEIEVVPHTLPQNAFISCASVGSLSLVATKRHG